MKLTVKKFFWLFQKKSVHLQAITNRRPTIAVSKRLINTY